MLITALIDFVFPPTEETLLVRRSDEETLMKRFAPSLHEGMTALLPFTDPLVRACVHEAKFHSNRKAMKMLGKALSVHLKTLQHETYTIIPVPLSAKRRRDRGYNQVTEIVRYALTEISHITLQEGLLRRARDTRPQTDLPRKERLINMRNAFTTYGDTSLKDVHVLLIDDVVTSGATLGAAKAALLPLSPASIRIIALAH